MTFKVGDKVAAKSSYGTKLTKGKEYEVLSTDGFYFRVRCDNGFVDGFSAVQWELVAPTGPVRTVTRREVVPGVYGIVGIGTVRPGEARVGFAGHMGDGSYFWASSDQLKAAAAVLLELAGALDSE